MEKTSPSLFNPLKWPIMCSVGVMAISQYIFFSFLAFIFFPDSFNPFNNFLSQLGNFEKNPDGAIFYFLAILFSGLLTVLFYWGFYLFHSKDKSPLILKSILILGIVNGLSICLSGIFSESVDYPLHFLFSFLIFFTLLPLLLVTNIYIWNNHQNYMKITYFSGFIVVAVDSIFTVLAIIGGDLFSNAAIFEWLSIFTYFTWMLLIIYNVLDAFISSVNKPE